MIKRRQMRKAKPTVGDLTDPHSLACLTFKYLEWMRVHNYSEETVEDREFHLRRLIEWCDERAVTRAADVTRAVLERYQQHLYQTRKADGKSLTFHYQHVRLTSLKAFFKWLAQRNHILYSPAADLEMPRREQRLPRHVLTSQEAEAIINQANVREPMGVRDRAIMETLYSTGIRRAELCALSEHDLDVSAGTVRIRQGKGKKDRVVPIGERAVCWVDKYRLEVRPGIVRAPDTEELFLMSSGEPILPGYLSGLIRRYVESAEIGKRGACHLFRHTCATLMLEGGADIRYIQQMLGHALLETTQVYTQVSIRKLKEIHTATHPARLARRGDAQTRRPDTETRGRGDEAPHEVTRESSSLAAEAAAPQQPSASPEPINSTQEESSSLAAEAAGDHQHHEDNELSAGENFLSLAAVAAVADDEET
jgi:integrase/recombinase XerD